MLEFSLRADPRTMEGRVLARAMFDLMDQGLEVDVVEPRQEFALAAPSSMLSEIALLRPEDLPEGADPFDPAPYDFPPPSAGPSTADPLPPMQITPQEGPTRADEPEPEICETGEKYSDPIPWPVPFIPPAEMVGAGMVVPAPVEVATAAEAPVVASVEVASTASTTEEGADLDAAPSAPSDTQGGEEPATPAAAPAPAEQSGDRAGGEAPPAANVEVASLDPKRWLDDAGKAEIWWWHEAGADVTEIAAAVNRDRRQVYNYLYTVKKGIAAPPAMPAQSTALVVHRDLPPNVVETAGGGHRALDADIRDQWREDLAERERMNAVTRAAE